MQTGDIYRATESIREFAADTFTDLESDDSLPTLISNLLHLRDEVITLLDVANAVEAALAPLGGPKPVK